MRSTHFIVLAALCAAAACSQDSSPTKAPTAPRRDVATSGGGPLQQTNWSPAPPIIPPGAEIVVLQGNPFGAEPFTVRLRFPSGYFVPPHTHPTVENVTVLTGTIVMGMGAQVSETGLQTFGKDDFFSMPANSAHYITTRGETVIQLHGIGPVAFNYVNPADNPAAR